MATRDTAPNSAFACIVEIKGKTHRLLRHHTEEVQDGTEHDTVDAGLLKASLNMVEQLKIGNAISEEEYEEARAHLQAHARSIVVDPQPNDIQGKQPRYIRRDLENDPDMARRIVSEQSGAPDGNQNLTSPRTEGDLPADPNIARRAEENLAQPSAGGSITGKGSSPTEEGEKSTENPAGVKGDIKHETDKGPAGADVDTKKGKATPAHPPKVSETSEGRGENPGQHTEMPDDKNVNNPNSDQQADARVDDKLKGKKTKGRVGEPTKKGKEPNKKADPEMEDDATPEPKGKDTKKAEAPHKGEKKK